MLGSPPPSPKYHLVASHCFPRLILPSLARAQGLLCSQQGYRSGQALLCELWEVASPLCVSTFQLQDGNDNNTLLVGLLWGRVEITYGKSTALCLARSECLVHGGYYCGEDSQHDGMILSGEYLEDA